MSMRTYDPKETEVFPPALCGEIGCGKPYHSICKLCNIAFCVDHLREPFKKLSETKPHRCDTGIQFLVLTEDEVIDLFSNGEESASHVHVFSDQMVVRNAVNPQSPGTVERCECGAMRLSAPPENPLPAHVHRFDLRVPVGHWTEGNYVDGCKCGVMRAGILGFTDVKKNGDTPPPKGV